MTSCVILKALAGAVGPLPGKRVPREPQSFGQTDDIFGNGKVRSRQGQAFQTMTCVKLAGEDYADTETSRDGIAHRFARLNFQKMTGLHAGFRKPLFKDLTGYRTTLSQHDALTGERLYRQNGTFCQGMTFKREPDEMIRSEKRAVDARIRCQGRHHGTLIAAELVFGATSRSGGLGWFIFEKRNALETPSVFAGLLTVIVLGLLVEAVVSRTIERRSVRRWGMQR